MSRTPSLLRQVSLLVAIADGARRFTDLRQVLPDVPASTVARMLQGLAAAGLVDHGSGYRLAPGATALAMRLLAHPDGAAFRPLVAALARSTGLSASCWIREGGRVVLVAKQEVPGGFHYIDLHASRPIADSAFGQAARGGDRVELVERQAGWWRFACGFAMADGMQGAIGVSAHRHPGDRLARIAAAAASAAAIRAGRC